MSARRKFDQRAVGAGNNINSAVRKAERDIARLQGAEGRDVGVQEAADAVRFDANGAELHDAEFVLGGPRIGREGIEITQAGDAVLLDDRAGSRGVISQVENANIFGTSTGLGRALGIQSFYAGTSNLVSNGGFETGDFTSWTETDTGSKISVSAEDVYSGNYAVKFVGAAAASDSIAQSITLSSVGVVVRMRVKVTASTCLIRLVGGTTRNLNEVTTNAEWRVIYVYVPGSTTSITISVTNNAGNICYLDDIEVFALAGAGSNDAYSRFLVGPGWIQLKSYLFRYENTAGDTIINAQADGTGKFVKINDSGGDVDFIIEGDTDTMLLYVDAGLDRIGIGDNTPSEKLDVAGNIRTQDSLVIDEQASAPSNPATGDWKLYAKSDGLHILDDAGNSVGPLGTGGGGGSDGWNAASDTWTRTGDHTFTVSGDVTATYRKGTKIRYKDGGSYEYGVIISSSHSGGTTTVQLCPNSDYAMAAATITDKYLSYIENPEGFPDWFNWAPAATGYSGTPTTNGLIKFASLNAYVHVRVDGTSNATTLTVTNLPVAPAMGFDIAAINGVTIDNGTIQTTPGRAVIVDATTTIIFRSNTANGAWTNSGNKRAQTFIFYKF